MRADWLMRRVATWFVLLLALSLPCATITAQPAGQTVPAMTASGIPAETTKLLLGALDPGVRIVGEAHNKAADGTTQNVWMTANAGQRPPEKHPDRLLVTIDAPAGSKAFSLVVAGLSRVGFMVMGVASVALPDNAFGFRYLIELAADKPVLSLRVTDAIARDSRAGEGHAVLIGAWKQAP
jgi:hypothetical protein